MSQLTGTEIEGALQIKVIILLIQASFKSWLNKYMVIHGNGIIDVLSTQDYVNIHR